MSRKIGDEESINEIAFLLRKYGNWKDISEKLNEYELCKEQNYEMKNLQKLLI